MQMQKIQFLLKLVANYPLVNNQRNNALESKCKSIT